MRGGGGTNLLLAMNTARKALGIDEECLLILTMAFGFKDNPHKDITTVLKAFKKVNEIKMNTKLLVVGDSPHKYSKVDTKNIIFICPFDLSNNLPTQISFGNSLMIENVIYNDPSKSTQNLCSGPE